MGSTTSLNRMPRRVNSLLLTSILGLSSALVTASPLVPDAPEQATSDHGWDFRKHAVFLKDVVGRLKAGAEKNQERPPPQRG